MNFCNIWLNKKLYENISVHEVSYRTPTGPKPLRIRFNEISRFIVFLDGKTKHLILFDYWLFNKICNKIKYLIIKKVVLQIVLIIILGRSELINVILYRLKTYWLFIMLYYSLSQLFMRMKINTTIIYFHYQYQ